MKGRTYYVDFKNKELMYVNLREYDDSNEELLNLYRKAVLFNSYEANYCLDMYEQGDDIQHAIESLRDIIAENIGA